MTTPYTLELLATSIAGCAVAIDQSDHHPSIAVSDGHSIYIHCAQTDWRGIAAQSALIAIGAFDPKILRQLIRQPNRASRYTIAEFYRGLAVCEARLPATFSNVFHKTTINPTSCEDSLALALADIDLPNAPDFLAPINPLFVLRHQRRSSATHDLADPGTDKYIGGNPSPLENRPKDKPGDKSFNDKSDWAQTVSTLVSWAFSSGRRENIDTNDGVAADFNVSSANTRRRDIRASFSAKPPTSETKLPSRLSRASFLPEWNERREEYRADWVHLETVSPWLPDGPKDLSGVFAPPPSHLYRSLAKLGAGYKIHGRQSDGSDLDTDEMIKHAIDIQAGNTSRSLNIYRALKKSAHNIGVSIMLDVSGSSTALSPDGEPVFNKQLRLAQQLGDVFSSLDIAIALTGFQAWGHKAVRMSEIKAPSKPWTHTIRGRMKSLDAAGFSRIGAAVRHGTEILDEIIKTPTRLLIIITDGIAFDHDYEGRYAEHDIRRALLEAQQKGCACLCLSVGVSASDETLSTMFGNAAYIAADDINGVTKRFGAACQAALAQASTHRSRF